MDLTKRFLHFKTKAAFDAATPGPLSIAFILETKEIWTHGTLYGTDPEYSLTVDSEADENGKKYIRLTDKNGTDLGKIDTTDFIKDGMLNTVAFDEDTKILTLTFNTDSGKEAITVNLTSLVDTYDGSNVKLSSIEIPETATEPSAGDSVDSAIANLIALDRDNKLYLTNLINLNVSGLLTSIGLLILLVQRSAYEGIENGEDGDYVTTTITEKADNKLKVSVAVTTSKITEVSETKDGLAVASDVKSYITDLFAWEELD